MKILLPLHILLLVSPVLCAQNAAQASDWVIQGKVTELVTGRGIATATVEAIDSHQIVHTTLSNPDGTFRLEHLPHEQSVTVRCSQLGYSPNPRGDKATFTDGASTWNPRLVPDNADAAYLHAAASYLASLPQDARRGDATDLTVYLPSNKRAVIAADLQTKFQSLKADDNLKTTVTPLFVPGPTLDKAITAALFDHLTYQKSANLEEMVRTNRLKVEVIDGVATVKGQVKTKQDKDYLHNRVAEIPSVSGINDQLTVDVPKSANVPPRVQ